MSPKLFARGFEEAESLVDTSVEMDIQGYDIDPQIVKAARENAKRAGVDGLIHFQQRPVHHLSHPKKYGFVITNPPYGERLEEKEDLPRYIVIWEKLSQDLMDGQNMLSQLMRMQNVISERRRRRTVRFITE